MRLFGRIWFGAEADNEGYKGTYTSVDQLQSIVGDVPLGDDLIENDPSLETE